RRAAEAAELAISSPLLEDVSIDGATGVLINITGGPDLTLHEVNEASSLIEEAAHEEANIIFGSVIDANIGDEVRITVIATGFDRALVGTADEDNKVAKALAKQKQPEQITLPYEASSQVTRDYPPPKVTAPEVEQDDLEPELAAGTIDEPMPVVTRAATATDDEVPITEGPAEDERFAAEPEPVEPIASERAALQSLEDSPFFEEPDPAQRPLAQGSGPTAADEMSPRPPVIGRKKSKKFPQVHPSLRHVLEDELESELDVPTFLRRHGGNNT
ncbi:MAG: hypothetical protein KJO07_03400, partial [Deltaproteobacteria bacterium]|nr:hypothetical protein [Deltaproteobacteria bacterium]